MREATEVEDVPIYEYRCDTCDEVFELRRSLDESSAPASCPAGHVGARRVLSVFATVGHSSGEAAAPMEACGPDCACAAAGY